MYCNKKRNPELMPKLSMNGSLMQQSHIERDLEIYLTSDLKWGYQTSQAANKENAAIGQLKRNFKCWTISTFKQLYMAFIRPHLEYAIHAWSPYL